MSTETKPALVRLADWPSRLNAIIAERAAVPFKWGAQDCCTFAADAIAAITGADLMARYRGYDSAITAGRIFGPAGGIPQVVEQVARDHALPEWAAVLLARRGDLCLVESETDGPALGICIGSRIAAAGTAGLVFVSLNRALRAWRIG